MSHKCHAIGCDKFIKPEFLMCWNHWRRVSKENQNKVWRTYRPGQCDDKKPSVHYCVAAFLAVVEVGEKEGYKITGNEPELFMYLNYINKLAQAGEETAAKLIERLRSKVSE